MMYRGFIYSRDCFKICSKCNEKCWQWILFHEMDPEIFICSKCVLGIFGFKDVKYRKIILDYLNMPDDDCIVKKKSSKKSKKSK